MKTYARELVARLPGVAPEYAYVTFSRGGNFGWSEQIALPLALRRARLDLVHFLSQYVPVLLPPRFVVTIHDLIHLRFPQYFKAKVGPYYASVVRYACARAKRVITDDERTVDDLERFLARRPREGARRCAGRRGELSESARAPRGSAAVFALRRQPSAAQGSRDALRRVVVAAGAVGDRSLCDGSGRLCRRAAAAAGSTRSIVALGDVTTERLVAYYAGATALVQPALREGFGLPMLEAMAVGCPVVACEDAVPRPLAEAALTFGARDSAELRARLERLLTDGALRMRSIELGRAAAKELTWERCARATADVYREILEEG